MKMIKGLLNINKMFDKEYIPSAMVIKNTFHKKMFYCKQNISYIIFMCLAQTKCCSYVTVVEDEADDCYLMNNQEQKKYICSRKSVDKVMRSKMAPYFCQYF